MIWIMAPLMVTWLWTVSRTWDDKRGLPENIGDVVSAIILTGTTSLTIWSSSTSTQYSLIRERPEMATVLMVLMIVALVAMFWIKYKRAKP